MTFTTRSRPITKTLGPSKIDSEDTLVWDPSVTFKTSTGLVPSQSITGKQVTVSEGHPFHSRKQAGLTGDVGGDFFTQKFYVEGGSHQGRMLVEKQVGEYIRKRTYTGPIFPIYPYDLGFPPASISSLAEIDAKGATAIARCKPTNSVANASVAVGELLKDGIPHAVGSTTWKEKTVKAKSAGDEFLNVEFGWLPLISDIRSFANAVQNASTILNQYERDAGKVVRRRYNFPIQKEFSESVWNPSNRIYPMIGDSTFLSLPLGECVRDVEKSQRQWFAGAFTYHLPTGTDTRSKMELYALEAKKLFGISLTPDTLWNLTPWSWALDWFSNTGDVVSNLSDWAVDGLVMHYGYMMEETIVKHTYSHVGPTGLIGSPASVADIVLVIHTKTRRRANPFGFGVEWGGLSPRQLLIAAALGISRIG